uniref:Uncharacterized protein n=1 Tax=Zea mays TaxID=4577 RepID=C4J1Y4_MAIZE|nr:unknown [Zea mays]
MGIHFNTLELNGARPSPGHIKGSVEGGGRQAVHGEPRGLTSSTARVPPSRERTCTPSLQRRPDLPNTPARRRGMAHPAGERRGEESRGAAATRTPPAAHLSFGPSLGSRH